MLSGKLGSFGEGVEKVSGDVTKNCQAMTFPAPKTRQACSDANGIMVVSKDTIGTSNVCCTK